MKITGRTSEAAQLVEERSVDGRIKHGPVGTLVNGSHAQLTAMSYSDACNRIGYTDRTRSER